MNLRKNSSILRIWKKMSKFIKFSVNIPLSEILLIANVLKLISLILNQNNCNILKCVFYRIYQK